MAWAEKYRGELYSNEGRHYYIKIYEDGYGGSVNDVDVTSAVITYRAVDDLLEPIRSSVLSLGVVSSTDFYWEDFFEADYGDYKVEVYDIDKAQIEWVGYNVTEIYSEPYEVPPYNTMLKFTDGLVQLKDINFPDNSGLKHIIQVLRLCLNSVNALNINDCYNIFEDSMTSGNTYSPLVQTYVNSSAYTKERDGIEQPMNCYEILEGILKSFACAIVQSEGEWWVYRLAISGGTSYAAKNFTPSIGTESSTTINSTATKTINFEWVGNTSYAFSGGSKNCRQVGGSGTFTFEEKIRRLKYIYEPFNSKSGLIWNGGFEINYDNPINQNNLPVYWSKNNMTYLTSGTDISTADYYNITKYDGLSMRFVRLGIPDSTDPIVNNKYIYQQRNGIYISTSDKITISAKCYFNGYLYDNSYLARMFFRIKLTEVSSGDVYYMGNVGQFGYSWQQSPVYGVIDVNHGKEVNFVLDESVLPVNPVTGIVNIEVRIYKPFYVYDLSDYGHFDLHYFNVNYKPQGTTLTKREYVVETEAYRDAYEWKVLHGEGTNNAGDYALRESSGTLLTTWGAGSDTIHDVVVEDIMDIRGGSGVRLSTRLQGKIFPIYNIQRSFAYPSGTVTKYFNIRGQVWDLATDMHDVELSEVKSFSPVFSNTHDLIGIDLPEENNDILADRDPAIIGAGASTTTSTDTTNTFL